MSIRNYKVNFALLLLSMLVFTPSANAHHYPNSGTFTTTSGDEVAYGSFEGQLLVIEAIQTTCSFCKDPQHRSMMKELVSSYAGQVSFLIVSIRQADTLNDLLAFASEYQITITVGKDNNNAVPSTYGLTVTPTTYIINEDGGLAFKFDGVQENIEVYADKLNALVDSPVTSFSSPGGSGGGAGGPSVVETLFTNPLFLGGLGIFILLTLYFRLQGSKSC